MRMQIVWALTMSKGALACYAIWWSSRDTVAQIYSRCNAYLQYM